MISGVKQAYSVVPDCTPVGRLFQRHFTDVDELASSLPDSGLQLTQLSLQAFQGQMFVLDLTHIRFMFGRANCSIKAAGNKISGFLPFICMPHDIHRSAIAHGLEITENHLYGFDCNRGVDHVFPSDTTYCSIHIRAELFTDCAEALDRPDLNTQFFAPNCLFVPETLPPLRAYLNQLYELIKQQSPLLQQPNFQQLILQDFLPLLVTALPVQQDRLKRQVNSFQRVQLVKQAEEYMLSHLHQPLTLTDLCQALGTSSRTLSYGFQDVFSTSPMSYLKILRLQGVHRALKLADPSVQTVSGIANQFGFWSLGHFSRDYQQMFGELPSETVRRSVHSAHGITARW